MAISTRSAKCRRKFLEFFPGGFQDETYLDWERDYEWATHKRWVAALGQSEFGRLLRAGEYREIAARAVRVEDESSDLALGQECHIGAGAGSRLCDPSVGVTNGCVTCGLLQALGATHRSSR